jgi:tetratricopeptide (TPR) repeat protein
MTDLKELFGKAEHERIHGSTEKAIVLYARILSLNPNPEMRIEALHMLGVCLRVVGRYEESVGHLWDVLDLSIDDRRRAHVLRDRADSYRCLKDFSGARKDIRDSYEIYCRIDGSPSERGATLGFEARLDFNESYVYHALLLGQQAAALLAEGGDGEPQLYNELWLARIKVHAGLNPKFNIGICQTLLDAGYGKEVHRQRLRAITEYVGIPEAMEIAIRGAEQLAER